MNAVLTYFCELFKATRTGWNQFWFIPTDAATLAVIRILTGGMLFYTHAVWTIDLGGFFGLDGRISMEFVDAFHDSPFAWTIWRWIDSATVMWLIHLVALAVFAMVTVGVFTPVTTIVAFLLATSYAHRATGSLFGLDQINLMLAMYLMIGDSGRVYSVDAWRRGLGDAVALPAASIRTNIAIRLMQLHLCVIYFFAALGKLQGETWWDGMAMWLALGNYEYQSIDMTFLARWPWLINFVTHVSLLWELSYCVLIWPRLTRPLVLALAVPIHAGIGVCLGMITFGTIMLIANLAFVPPEFMRSVVGYFTGAANRQGHPSRSALQRSNRR